MIRVIKETDSTLCCDSCGEKSDLHRVEVNSGIYPKIPLCFCRKCLVDLETRTLHALRH